MTARAPIESMTGFGRGTAASPAGELVVELRSVNSRALDVRLRAPGRLAHLEAEVHEAIRKQIARGRIDCTIALPASAGGRRIDVDEAALGSLLAALKRAVAAHPEVAPTLDMGALLRMPALFVSDDDEDATALAAAAHAALAVAIPALLASRAREGALLDGVLRAHLDRIDALRGVIAGHADGIAERQRARLHARLAELAPDLAIDPARIAAEVALLADRADVTEELARLTAHTSHARALLDAGGAVGRKLDFLCQEFLREANTTGSKSSDADLTHVVVDLKAEIERFREQVQNVA